MSERGKLRGSKTPDCWPDRSHVFRMAGEDGCDEDGEEGRAYEEEGGLVSDAEVHTLVETTVS